MCVLQEAMATSDDASITTFEGVVAIGGQEAAVTDLSEDLESDNAATLQDAISVARAAVCLVSAAKRRCACRCL